MSRIAPALSRIRGRLGLSTRYQDAASRHWVISPAVDGVAPAAVFAEDDLHRITGVHPNDTISAQVARARGGRASHGATIAYELKNAVLSGGNLFNHRAVMPISGTRLGLVTAAHAQRIPSAALASSQYGIRYFGHWIADDLITLLAAREIAEPISVLTNPLRSQSDILRLLDLDCRTMADAVFDRIVVIDDVGQNAYKRARYQKLFEIGQRHCQPKRPAGVLLLRGRSGARRVLTNEAQVAAMARRRNMAVVDPEQTSAQEIIGICSGIELVVGVEGSHLYNGLMWMSRSGALVVIQPPQRFVMVTKDLCDCVGIRMAFIVGHPVDETDFSVDVGSLERLCDRLAVSASS